MAKKGPRRQPPRKAPAKRTPPRPAGARPARVQPPTPRVEPPVSEQPAEQLSESVAAEAVDQPVPSQAPADEREPGEPEAVPGESEAGEPKAGEPKAGEPEAVAGEPEAVAGESETGAPEPVEPTPTPASTATQHPGQASARPSVGATPAAAPRPRRPHVRAAALIGVLTAMLGFAIAVQVRANSSSDSLSSLREEDLIGILDNQNARADRLRGQIADLQQTLNRLQDSGDQSAAAQQQAKQDAEALGVLLGTLPATGPGVDVRITDPQGKLRAEDLLDVVEELRGAGAEAIEFSGVRVSTDTAFRDENGRVTVDGAVVGAPYRVIAIGDSTTLDTALNIPGGVAATVRAAGGDLTVTEQKNVLIDTIRQLPDLKYVKPATH